MPHILGSRYWEVKLISLKIMSIPFWQKIWPKTTTVIPLQSQKRLFLQGGQTAPHNHWKHFIQTYMETRPRAKQRIPKSPSSPWRHKKESVILLSLPSHILLQLTTHSLHCQLACEGLYERTKPWACQPDGRGWWPLVPETSCFLSLRWPRGLAKPVTCSPLAVV